MNGRGRGFSSRLADAIDLAIDFATLGEYGLEPIGAPATVECRAGRRRGYESRLPGRSPTSGLSALQR
jgi:hypothetical protein